MTYFIKTICPICNSNLEHITYNRYDTYQCDKHCYSHSYWTGEFSHIQSVLFRIKDYVIRYVQDDVTKENIMYLYKNDVKFNMWSGSTYITTIPAIEFSWTALDELNERLKKLIIFS